MEATKINNKLLLEEICDYYNFELKINDNEIYCDNLYNWKCTTKTINEMLKEMLDTMEESNKSIFETGDVDTLYNTWSKEEIDFIKELQI